MSDKELREEIEKCKKSAYYFATTYMTVNNQYGKTVKYETMLTEKEFNDYFKNIKNQKYRRQRFGTVPVQKKLLDGLFDRVLKYFQKENP